MKKPAYIKGTAEEVSDDGAVIKLSDGRTGFVSSSDYFFEDYTDRADLGGGDQVMVRELGPGSDGELLLGLQPRDVDNGDRVGIEVEWVTSLEEQYRTDCHTSTRVGSGITGSLRAAAVGRSFHCSIFNNEKESS